MQFSVTTQCRVPREALLKADKASHDRKDGRVLVPMGTIVDGQKFEHRHLDKMVGSGLLVEVDAPPEPVEESIARAASMPPPSKKGKS